MKQDEESTNFDYLLSILYGVTIMFIAFTIDRCSTHFETLTVYNIYYNCVKTENIDKNSCEKLLAKQKELPNGR